MINTSFILFLLIVIFGSISKITDNKKVSDFLYISTGIALILFCGLKEVGSDQDSVAYARYFTLDNYSLSQVAEPTFSYIAEISRWISNKNGLIILFFIYATLGVVTYNIFLDLFLAA